MPSLHLVALSGLFPNIEVPETCEVLLYVLEMCARGIVRCGGYVRFRHFHFSVT